MLTMSIILVLVLLNFIGNVYVGNDCGFYSVRGFAACLVSVCNIAALFIAALLFGMIEIFNKVFNFKPRAVLNKEME